MDEAEHLVQVAAAATGSVWTLSQTLVHCAQGIEYSMTGFPQMKSEIFQNAAGTKNNLDRHCCELLAVRAGFRRVYSSTRSLI